MPKTSTPASARTCRTRSPEPQLLAGDRIIGVNDRPVTGRTELQKVLATFRGDRVKLNIIRNGERKNVFLPRNEAVKAGRVMN